MAAEVIVAGGGPAGLAAAFRLQEAGHHVRVLEAGDAAGSKLSSRERDGFLLDRGAYFIPTTHHAFLRLAADAGIEGELVPGGFVFAVARDGRMHRLDGARLGRDFARTRLISPRAKLGAVRIAPTVLRSRRARPETIAEVGRYDTRDIGAWAGGLHPELAEYLVGAAMRAIYGAEADELSFVEWLGTLALFAGARLVAFRRGMAFYAEQLAKQLDVRPGSQVLEVEQTAAGARVTWRDADGEHTEEVAGCVIALPAGLAADVLPGLDPWRAGFLRRVRARPLIVPNIALSRAPRGIDATYVMVPRPEHPFLGGIVLDHNKAPGRAPEGKGLLTLTLVAGWCERHADADDEAVAAAALEAADRFLPGTSDAVEFIEVSRWHQQYPPVGHYAQLAEFLARSAAQDRAVQLAGEYTSAPQLSAATASGERAAAALDAALVSRPR